MKDKSVSEKPKGKKKTPPKSRYGFYGFLSSILYGHIRVWLRSGEPSEKMPRAVPFFDMGLGWILLPGFGSVSSCAVGH